MIDQPRQDLRGLKALVGILGVLIILGTALVISVVIHRLYARNIAPSSIMPASHGTITAKNLAPGEKILGIAGAGTDLAIWVGNTQGSQILLVNPANGQMTTIVSTAP
ncbi:MAG: hypothetical protein POH28_04050 [Acidocella sp.]|nr:hypothetical protein [Acidocella sp.]